MQPHLVYSNNHIDPTLSYFLAVAVVVLAVGAIVFAVQQMLHARRAAKVAEGAHHPHAPITPGGRFVAGVVEFAQGESVAVDVTVTQRGTEQSNKNGVTHHWTEVGRMVRARPFYLRHASGQRVRVEPPPHIVLVDRLDQRSWQLPAERRVRAALTPGEFAVVEGQVRPGLDPESGGASQGYRDGATGWVMGPRPDGGMEASTESLARRHQLRARGMLRAAVWATGLTVLGALPSIGFWSRVLVGEDRPADFLGTTTWIVRSNKGGRTRHYGIRVREPSLSNYSQRYEIDSDDYEALEQGERPAQVWMRIVPDSPDLSALGTGVSLHAGVFAFFALMGVAAAAVVAAAHGHRRWYEGRANHHGNGRLGIPTGERFHDEIAPAPQAWPAPHYAAPQWPAPSR